MTQLVCVCRGTEGVSVCVCVFMLSTSVCICVCACVSALSMPLHTSVVGVHIL